MKRNYYLLWIQTSTVNYVTGSMIHDLIIDNVLYRTYLILYLALSIILRSMGFF